MKNRSHCTVEEGALKVVIRAGTTPHMSTPQKEAITVGHYM